MRRLARALVRAAGYELVPHTPIQFGHRPDRIVVPRHLCPSADKLFDFRTEDGFAAIARRILDEGRTFLEHNRLFVLWHAVRNTYRLDRAAAEVGSYKGGSAKFIAEAFGYWGRFPTIHVIDTFEGHPDVIVPAVDGTHAPGAFSDTSYDAVKSYLAPFGNVNVHAGAFQDQCSALSDLTFGLVHIDVDIYRSTADCLQFFWPRLCDAGVIVVDDYGFVTCHGAKQAVDEFLDGLSCQAWYMHTGQMVIQK
jgi:O-methyltransferase